MSFKKSLPLLFVLASITLAALFDEGGGREYNFYLEAPCLTGVLHGDTRTASGSMHTESLPPENSIYSLGQDAVSCAYFQSAENPGLQAFNVPDAAKKIYTCSIESKYDLITSGITNKSPPYYLL